MSDNMKRCLLEGCNKPARKKFCSNKHKDRWHNRYNPRGYYAHLNHGGMQPDEVHPNTYGHPLASGDEGHGQE